MKKLICILASAALFGACEQKTEVAPAAPADKKESNTTIVNPPKSETGVKEKSTTTNTITNAPPTDGSVEKKTESTTTTTTSSPNP